VLPFICISLAFHYVFCNKLNELTILVKYLSLFTRTMGNSYWRHLNICEKRAKLNMVQV